MWILFLIFTGTMINAIDRSSMGAANSFIAKDLHLDPATMGIILSVFGWTYVLFNLPAGWLSDRFGTKKVYGIAASIWSIASAMTGLAKTSAHLIISRAFVGLGEAANFPSATKVVAENFSPASRNTATGIYLAGLRLGYALTPGIMIGLMVWFGSQAHPNWRMAFIITGLGSLLWVVLWFSTFRENVRPKKNGKTSRLNQALTLELLKKRNTWAIVCIKFFQDYIYYLYLTWLPSYLIEERHMDLEAVAFYATLPWVAGMMAQPLIGMLADFLIKKGLDPTKVKKSLLVLMQLIALTIVGAAFAPSAETAAWCLIIALAAESASTAILWTLPQDLAPRGTAGTLGGIMNTAGAGAAIVSPMMTGFIVQYAGFPAALIAGGCSLAFSILSVCFFLTRIRTMTISHDLIASGKKNNF